MNRSDSPLPPPPSHISLLSCNMTDLSFNDGNSPTDKESQVPLFARRPRSSNDNSSTSSQSPSRLNNNAVVTNESFNRPSGKDRPSYYSSLSFTDDTMFNAASVMATATAISGSGHAPQTLGPSEERLRGALVLSEAAREDQSACSSVSSCINEKRLFAILCQFCGQCHEKNLPHLYDYSQSVDPNLLCIICNQPLVDPLVANCNHTFCTACLEKHLTKQALCPLDNTIINYLSCKPASIIVKKLLDKLKVVCPNVDYCEEILYRNNLYNHLKYKCRGAVMPCINASIGCTFQGSRNSFSTHQWECKYKDAENGRDPIANDVYNFKSNIDDNNENGDESDCNLKKDCSKERNQVIEGEPCEIEITRVNQRDLGFSFIGGIDSPLGCIVIQEIYLDGIISQDCRLRPGDQLLEINNFDLTSATHVQAKRALSTLSPKCKFLVFRECAPVSNKFETFTVTLVKRPDSQLGIVLDKKKNHEGIYIRNIIPGSEAHLNSFLAKGDRILYINNIDIGNGTQEYAAKIIREALDNIVLLVQRRLSVPDIVKTTDDRGSLGSWSTSSTGGGGGIPRDSKGPPQSELISRRQTISSNKSSLWSEHNSPRIHNTLDQSRWIHVSTDRMMQYDNSYQHLIMPCQLKEEIITVHKKPFESLSITVTGGINSHRGDIPIYITNIFPNGALSVHRQVKKGSILLGINNNELLNLTHKQAVDLLKRECYNSSCVQLHVLEGPETSSGAGNFMPSWKYWLQLPLSCASLKSIELFKENLNLSLGFSIVGGIDSATNTSQPLSFWDTCIMIKTILPGSIAFTNGKLKCGDILFEVNNASFAHISHADAVLCLKKTTGRVVLKIISWPGTIV